MSEAKTVTVSILDKSYQVACKPDEVAALKASADYLDGKMREVKTNAGVLGLDRIAVMAALNIANEYLAEANKGKDTVTSQNRELAELTCKLFSVLSRIKTRSG
jgi:cell division protein ZapA